MELTVAGIQRFFVAKGATDVCPSCSHRNWIISGTGQNGAYLGLPWCFEPTDDGLVSISASGASRAVIAISCTNCGFIRLHDQYPIRAWLQNEHAGVMEQGNLDV